MTIDEDNKLYLLQNDLVLALKRITLLEEQLGQSFAERQELLDLTQHLSQSELIWQRRAEEAEYQNTLLADRVSRLQAVPVRIEKSQQDLETPSPRPRKRRLNMRLFPDTP